MVAIVVYWLIPASYEIRNAVPTGETIVCFGDSLTAGIGAAPGMDYPARLSRLIGTEIINAGVAGDTTARALDRVEAVLELQPRIVMITLGGNDLKNGVGREVAFRNLEEIVSRFQDNGALVVIGGLDVPFWGRGFGDAYEELAEKSGAVLVVNILQGILGKADLMSDRIHPNSEGYAVMAQYFYKALRPYL
ncbi:MAG: GDSL-type esterase/lipase family protein [Thermodesulfobacteriota bacterium]